MLPFLAPLISGMRNGFSDVSPSPSPHSQIGMDEPEIAATLYAALPQTPLGQAISGLRSSLFWQPFIAASPRWPDSGIRTALVHGEGGLLGCDRLQTGFIVIPAAISTPIIEAAAPALYIPISGGVVLHHYLNGVPMPVSATAYVIISRNRVHRVTSSAPQPTLLFFARTGDLSAPLYRWEQSGDSWDVITHGMDRDGVWWPDSLEKATADRIAEATAPKE